VRSNGSPSRLREALADGRRELALYLGAGIAYVVAGVAFPEVLFAWVTAVGFLLAFVVVLPALVDRVRRGSEDGT
jgi:hypothetical protein